MIRAGVRPDISERVLGHAIKGVEGNYDHYPYTDEKGAALRRLAALIEIILAGKPTDDNLGKLRAHRFNLMVASDADNVVLFPAAAAS